MAEVESSGVWGASATGIRLPTPALAAAMVAAACAGPSPSRRAPEARGADRSHVSHASRAAAEPVRRVWPVMGTVLDVTVWAADAARARPALEAARAAVFRVDSLMSVYKPTSELSLINRRAGTGRSTRISRETAEVLDAALEIARRTGGALDVTVGPVVDAWGFYRPVGRVPPAFSLDSARALVGYRHVRFDRGASTVRLPRAGMRLDPGAIAKGYAVDLATDALREAGVRRGIVDLGGNIRVFGRAPTDGGWRVGLRDPGSTEAIFAVVVLDSGSVATSGDYERFFVAEGVRYSHIIDPRTARPVRGVASVSVVAPTGMLADALSTALFVLGPESGCRVARGFDGVDAVWIRDAAPDAERRSRASRGGDVLVTPGMRNRLEPGRPPPSRSRPAPAVPLCYGLRREPGSPRTVRCTT